VRLEFINPQRVLGLETQERRDGLRGGRPGNLLIKGDEIMKRVVPMMGMLLVAVLLAWPTAGKAEMYVEGYVGINFAAPIGKELDMASPGSALSPRGWWGSGDFTGHVNPAFLGGAKLGYWFVKEGFLGYNYPDWAKYFGVYFDLSYHKLPLRHQDFTVRQFAPLPVATYVNNNISMNGTVLTLAFMFAGRYGFLPDSEVPFGRLQPYLAVGPAILISSQRPTVQVNVAGLPFGAGMESAYKTSTNVALAVETGVRYLALKNVSLDLSFKYRYAQPHYRFDFHDNLARTFDVTYNPTYHFFSLQLGAAYHF